MSSQSSKSRYFLLAVVSGIIISCWLVFRTGASDDHLVLRLATTTSVENSGLLEYLLPLYEEESHVRVDFIAVGSGQAIELGQRGDVDVVLSHAPELEKRFILSGNGLDRIPIMSNDFIILGPKEDPADIHSSKSASQAFERIAESGSLFISRGDQSGTHQRELMVWQDTKWKPAADLPWYLSSGQGMGSSLLMANELTAYILSDRGTYLFQQQNLPDLAILFGGSSYEENPDPRLINPYSIIAVNPALHANINHMGAAAFIEWMASVPTQKKIFNYGREQFGISLFIPNSNEWRISLQQGRIDPQQIADQARSEQSELMSSTVDELQGREILQVVLRTLQVSGTSLLLACAVGLPLGATIGMLDFKFKRQLQILLYTGMGLPPVVVGLAAFLVLSNQGIFGSLNWLFTIKGMILAQTVLAFPLASGLTISAVEAVPTELVVQVRALGATPWQERWAVLLQARRGLMAAVLAALGRIISEVGAVMLVGGNIAGQTRVLSTAIVLETRQGSFGIALALGSILLGIALFSNAIVLWLGGKWPK